MPLDRVREIAGPAGPLEALLELPEGPVRAAAVIAHPHPQFGGTLHTKAVYQAAKALARIGVAALRFNFRGVGSSAGAFDNGVGEAADFHAALDFVAARCPGVPLWAAGMSFGSWIALTVGATDPRVSVLLGIAAPVDRYDYGAIAAAAKPTFLIHGEEDELISVKEVRRFYAGLGEPKDLVVIEGADHVFEGRTSLVADAVEDLLGDFDSEGARTS